MNFKHLLSTPQVSLLLAASLSLSAMAAQQSDTTGGSALNVTHIGSQIIDSTTARKSAAAASDSQNGKESGGEDITAQFLPVLPQTPETIDKLIKLEQLGEEAFENHEFEKALSKWQESYGLSKEMRSSDGEGRALVNMCRLYFERGQLVKAKELGENALEVLANASDKIAMARARVAIAQVYYKLDLKYPAGQQLELAMKSFAELGLTDAKEAAQVMYIAGDYLSGEFKTKEALQFYQGAASYFGQSGDLTDEVSLRSSLAGMFQEMGYLVAGKEEANKAVSAALNAKNPALLVTALATLANTQYNLGEYENARQRYEVDLSVPIKFADQVAIGQFQAGYGSTLSALGEYDNAKNYLESAAKILKSKGSALTQASVFNNLANVQVQMGQFAPAFDNYNQAMELQAIATPKRPKLRITIMQNLAVAQVRSGDNRAAKQTLTSLLPLFKTFENSYLEGRTYAALSEVSWNLKEISSAESFSKQAIAISEKIHDDASLWRGYTILAQVQLVQQQALLARETLNSAVSFLRSPQAGSFGSAECLYFPSSREELAQKLVSLLISQKMFEPAYSLAAQLKEESFLADWKRNGGSVKAADQEIYNDLTQQREHIHASEVALNPSRLVNEWQNWMQRFAQLSTENKPLAHLIAPSPLTAAEILTLAQQKHATILDYLVGSNSTIVFTISAANKIGAAVLPIGSKQLDVQVASLLNSAISADAPRADNQPADSAKRALQILGTELLPPSLMALLPKTTDETVVVIPDGALFNVPFAALVDASGKYLVESHAIAMSPSAAAFIDGEQMPEKLVAGGSALIAALGADTKGDKNAEATAVASAFGPDNSTSMSGNKPAIQDLEEKAVGNSYVHIAANTALPASDPLTTELPLSAGKDDKSPKLAAKYLFSFNLSPELFVLSGTSVNAKDTRGNAVKVLSRGLNYAGARNVMMSLWYTPEPARAGQLVDFYKESHNGISEAKSLRKSQLDSIAKNQSPRLWASYQLWGPSF